MLPAEVDPASARSATARAERDAEHLLVGTGVAGSHGMSGFDAPHRDRPAHSHSIVPGGFDVTSSTTRLTPSTSFVMRFEILASTS